MVPTVSCQSQAGVRRGKRRLWNLRLTQRYRPLIPITTAWAIIQLLVVAVLWVSPPHKNVGSLPFQSSTEEEQVLFHVFQIAKPHTGSTLLNCILQGLLDEPFEKYSFLFARHPRDNGRYGPYPPNADLADPYPFILHDSRLKLTKESIDVTAVTKTHIVDVDALQREFGPLFGQLYFIAANRAEKGISIDDKYCKYSNVLCLDYGDFSYSTGGSSLVDVVSVVTRVKKDIITKFPLLQNLDMDVEEAAHRVKLMEKATTIMAEKAFKEHEPYFGIHGGHRDRDDKIWAKRTKQLSKEVGKRESPPVRLVHVVPLYKVHDCEERFCPYDQDQSVAVASITRARNSSKRAKVTLAASVFAEDATAVSDDFVTLPNLTRSTSTEYANFTDTEKLPFIGDIFSNLRSSSKTMDPYEYVIYTNADIVLREDFYDIVASTIHNGYDAFTINRQTVPKTKERNDDLYTMSDLDEIFQLKGKVHPGSDCFVMKKIIFDQIDMGNLFLGHPPTANVLLVQLESLAERYRMFASHELQATFHLGDDKKWEASSSLNVRYEAINYQNAYRDLRYVWSRLCQSSLVETWKILGQERGGTNIGNSIGCSRLLAKFEQVAGYDISTALPMDRKESPPEAHMLVDDIYDGHKSIELDRRKDSPIVFQFLVGLEGTGHHLHRDLYKGSPAHKRLKKYGVLAESSKLLNLLWNKDEPSKGLWSSACAMVDSDPRWWKVENNATDGDAMLYELVAHLREMEAKIRREALADNLFAKGEDLVVAVNSGSVYSQGSAPFLSYPLLGGPCRALQYPNLDIFYRACDMASVRCQHTLSFRDPYRILKSTSMNRNFAARHVQLETLRTMLGMIQNVMLSYPDRLVGCWSSDLGLDGGVRNLARLYGWNDESLFERFFDRTFQVPPILSNREKRNITKEGHLDIYMASFSKSLDTTKKLCRAQELANRGHAYTQAVSTLPLPLIPASSAVAQLSEGSASPDDMTGLPDWLNRYIKFHHSSIEGDGNGGYRVKTNVPYIVYSCNGEERCGGIGDRVNAMVIVLYLAMCSGRVLLIDSPYPSPLQNFLEPNEIRWDASEPLSGEGIPTLDIMDKRNIDMFVDHSTIGYRLGRCNGLPTRHSVKSIWSGQSMKNYFESISEPFPYEEGLPQEELLRWSFWALFKFSDNVLNRAKELKGSAGLTAEQAYIGIHLRTGDKSMDIEMKYKGPRNQNKKSQQYNYVRCYQKLRQSLQYDYVGYIASDSAEAKETVHGWDPSVRFAKDSNIFHVDESLKLEESGDQDVIAYEGSLDGWAELSLMADARCLVMSWSMFSFAAHFIGGRNRCGVYVGHCDDENVINPVHEYSYEAGRSPMVLESSGLS